MFNWRKKKQKPEEKSRGNSPRMRFCPTIKPLPTNFADEVISLEMKLQSSGDLDTLKQLLELYTQAIEYYESVRDPKYKYYQDRMQRLLTNKDIDTVISTQAHPQPITSPTARASETFNFDLASLSQHPIPEEKPKAVNLPQQRNAEKYIKSHVDTSRDASARIQQNLKNQLTNLSDKLEARKSIKKRNRSQEPTPLRSRQYIRQAETSVAVTLNEIEISLRRSLSKDRESDRGGGIPRKSIADEFEEELEKLMERFVIEKLEKSSKIQKHYNHQIKEVKGLGGMETIQQVIKEMERNMEQELHDLNYEIESKRKQEIAILKRKMLGVN